VRLDQLILLRFELLPIVQKIFLRHLKTSRSAID
jgi:hypothetical protein